MILTCLRLVAHQARFDLLSFIRNRQSRFFTLILPILFLVIFVSVFGNNRVGPQQAKASTYYVPGLAALGVIAGSFVNLVISITAQREAGVLKRRRSTPVPAWVLIAGRAVTAIVVALSVLTVLLLIGRFAYGVRLPAATLPGVALTAVVGAVVLLPRLRPLHGDPFGRRRPADGAGDHAAALLHLRRLHPERQPAQMAARCRRGLPGPAPRRRPPQRIRSRHPGNGNCLERPGRSRPLGRGRTRDRAYTLRLDSCRRHRLSASFAMPGRLPAGVARDHAARDDLGSVRRRGVDYDREPGDMWDRRDLGQAPTVHDVAETDDGLAQAPALADAGGLADP
jgi:hypothetical protein